VILEWVAREGWIVFNWWLLVTLAGLAALPLITHLLGGLPDKGYTLARAVGLLLVGFVFWLLASLGFLRNTPGSIVLAWLMVLVGGLVYQFRQPQRFDLRAWWRHNRPVIVTGEVLFVVLLVFFALYRAHIPAITSTEKPMELAFMSAVQRSETFPPNDPWLSGYAISYYYFGYVMSAALSMLSGIHSTIGFNMTISLLFALTGLTSFGVAYNLVASRFGLDQPVRGALACGLLGMAFVTLFGNFQLPLIELPYQSRAADESYLQFWATDQRLTPKPPLPEEAGAISPANWDYWWWFRASRVLSDTHLDGSPIGIQPIDEFPAFSFVLADVHPHVLALPFAVLSLGLALNLLLTGRDPTRAEVVFYGLALGGLVFLNTWDGPIYMVVLVGADAVRRLMRNGTGWLLAADWWALLRLGLWLGVLTLAFYLPFFISFRSQASGILPNLLHPTRFQQYFIMFGPFILIVGALLVLEMWLARGRMNWQRGVLAAAGLLVTLVLLMLLLSLFAALIPEMRGLVVGFVEQNGGAEAVLPLLLNRRLANSLTALLLLAGIAVVVARLFPRVPAVRELDAAPDEARRVIDYPPATGFALLLVGAGMVLTLVPEFLYLRDNFGVRINTIFKFYYQAWVMFGIASAYGVYVMIADLRLRGRIPVVRASMGAVTAVCLALGLLYPVLGFYHRMIIESGRASAASPGPLTLDGGPATVSADDYAAIMCFNDLVQGDNVVVLEAADPGSAYNITGKWGRVGMLTGVPIVLGWQNHQGQWRGPTYGQVVGSRPQDIDRIYTDLRWDVVSPLIGQYDIDYIFFGETERNKYGAQAEAKFVENLPVICERGGSRFFRVDPARLVARG
jgi:YYY domain-containing protein